MNAVCPNSKKHNTFITTAHMMEEWKVDSKGNWIETTESLEIVHGPDPGNEWTCATCGTQAKVESN